MEKRKVSFTIGVKHDTSVEQMTKCVDSIRGMLANHEGVNKEEILVHFEAFTDDSLKIFLYFFTDTTAWSEYLKVKEDVNLKIMNIFRELNIEFALSQHRVYLEKSDEKDQNV